MYRDIGQSFIIGSGALSFREIAATFAAGNVNRTKPPLLDQRLEKKC
jgi:hypothetical protein